MLNKPSLMGVPRKVKSQPGRQRVARFALQRLRVVTVVAPMRNFPNVLIGIHPDRDKLEVKKLSTDRSGQIAVLARTPAAKQSRLDRSAGVSPATEYAGEDARAPAWCGRSNEEYQAGFATK